MGTPLRARGFAPLAGSYAVNELGDMFGIVALAVLVFDESGTALGPAALFIAAKFLPALAAPALTAALDRRPVAQVLPALYVAEAVVFGLLALLAGSAYSFWLVLLLAFVDGLLALTGRGLSRAAISAVLKPIGALREGNAIINVLFAVTGAGGPALAGLVVAEAGVATALWLDAASFLAIAVLLAVRAGSLPAHIGAEAERWWRRLRSGLAEVRADPLARRLIGSEGVAIVFFTLIVPIEVVYVRETLRGDELDFGLLLGFWGAGIVVGSLVFARARRMSTTALVVGSTALVGLGYAGLALAPTLLVAFAASVVGGAGNGVQWVAVMTALQEAVDEDLQARAAGLLESVAAAAPGVGFVVGGLLAAAASPRAAYAVASAGVLAVALWWLARPPLDIRSTTLKSPV
jgi:MFS family permease